MKNRDALNKLGSFEIICRIHDGLGIDTDPCCVIDLIRQRSYMHQCPADETTCRQCIHAWLDEEEDWYRGE